MVLQRSEVAGGDLARDGERMLLQAIGRNGGADLAGYVTAALSIALLITAALSVCWSLRRDRGGSDNDDDDGRDGGGGSGRRDRTPPNRPPDTEPEWWPEFERQFAAYAARRLTSGKR